MVSARKFIHRLVWPIVPALAGTILFFSCKTDIEMVNALSEMDKVPTVMAKNIEILYTENGSLKVKIVAPESQYYQFAEEPYTEFPKGITVYNFNDSLKVESQITANYAIHFEKTKIWNAKYNVVAKNKKGQVLNTEQLFWDTQKKKIYSDDMVKITSADDIIFGQGFDSHENLDDWVIRKVSGHLYIEE
jgi:LPS export ABC transporter protein LptC